MGVAVAGGPPSPFVGREHELGVLAAAIAGDDGALVRVSGEAGVGKSRLVREALQRSRRRSLVGISSPGSLGRPFDLLLSAIEPVVRSWSEVPSALSAIRGALTELLRGVAPAIDGGGPRPETTSPSDLLSAAIALLRHLDPDVLVLEDLQWADIESLQVAERLLTAPDHPTLLVTYRSEDMDGFGTAAELLGTMGSRRTSPHLHLEPFEDAEIEHLVAAHLGHAPSSTMIARLRARTGGNAFFLEEVLASTDDVGLPSDSLDDLPETLTETLRLRLKTLSAPERDALATAAVLGSPFDFDLLATALEVDEDELIDRLRTLIDRRLVVEPEVDVFRFRHELVRESVLASLLGRERRRLHERAWNATLTHRPEAYAELARHAAGSGRLDDLARLAPDGVRHYLHRGSTRQAFLLAELALDEWPDDAELLELAARSAWLTGQVELAERYAVRWRDAAARMEGRYGIDALALIGRIAYELDDFDTEARIVAEMEELLCDVTEPAPRAQLLADLAQHHMLMNDQERALKRADEARQLAEEQNLAGLARQISVEEASAAAGLADQRADALAELERVAKEAEAEGEYVTASRALHNLSLYQHLDAADATLDELGRVAELGGFDLAAAVLLPMRKADIAVRRADLRAAQEWIDRARPFVQQLKTGKHLAYLEALVRLEAGAPLEPELLDRVADDAPWSWSVRMRYAAREGDLATVDALLDAPPESGTAAMAFATSLSGLLAAGVDRERIAATFDAILEAFPDQTGGELAAALVAEAVGDPDAESMLVAVDDTQPTFGPHGMKAGGYGKFVVGELWLARARIAARRGDRATSRQFAQQAADTLERWPGPRRDEALALAADEVCSDELTGREIDVARLVARGMTNGQIADELFIARKTVSTHVSHILTKLDMSSRTEIAAWAVRTGLDPVGSA